eukprot:s1993_g10.t1
METLPGVTPTGVARRGRVATRVTLGEIAAWVRLRMTAEMLLTSNLVRQHPLSLFPHAFLVKDQKVSLCPGKH